MLLTLQRLNKIYITFGSYRRENNSWCCDEKDQSVTAVLVNICRLHCEMHTENNPPLIRDYKSSRHFWSKFRTANLTEIIRRDEYNNYNDNYDDNNNNKFF